VNIDLSDTAHSFASAANSGNATISKIVLRSSGEELCSETDVVGIDKLLKIVANHRPAIKTEIEVKSEPIEKQLEAFAGSQPSEGLTDCYLPQTAFRTASGSLLMVKELTPGCEVLASDGSVISVVSSEHQPFNKYCIVELVTRKGSFTVSACHRIAVDNQTGRLGDPRKASDLRVGDHVFMGERKLPLAKVSHFAMRTELYKVAFHPDIPVESLIVPCGMRTHGELVPYPPMDFSAYSESDLLQAMPVQYED
jgi:hypothetical protein